jgi:hypothetical protein
MIGAHPAERKTMRAKVVRGLKLSATGGRNFVFVPTPSAQELRAYLQAKGFQPLQPQEMTSESSSLEIGPRNDLHAVQAALDQWGHPSTEA